MKFKTVFLAFWVCLGVMVGGIILANECLIVFGMICMSLNAAIRSVCFATIAPVEHRYEYYYKHAGKPNPELEEESEVIENVSSGECPVVGDKDGE